MLFVCTAVVHVPLPMLPRACREPANKISRVLTARVAVVERIFHTSTQRCSSSLSFVLTTFVLTTITMVLFLLTGSAVNSHELHEKWGWKTSDPLYWPYKIMGVFSTKNTNALSSARMLQTCLNNAEVGVLEAARAVVACDVCLHGVHAQDTR